MKKEKQEKPKKHRIRKMVLWIAGSILFLIVLIFLFLSVLFPSSYVKKIVVQNLQSQLKREVSLQELDFNVFTGIKIKGLEIKERGLFGKETPFVRLKSVNVDYSLLPLIFGKFVLNEATVRGAEVYLIAKKMDDRVRYNFDDLFQIPESQPEKKVEVEEKPAQGPAAPPDVKKPAMPIDFSLGEIGIEDAKLNYKDYSNPVLPAQYTVDKVTAIITNLTSGSEPFGIRGSVQISFGELKEDKPYEKNFNLFVGLQGNIKPFTDKGVFNPYVVMDFAVKDFVTEGSFLQTAINNGMKLALRDFINKIDTQLPEMTQAIKAKLQPQIDKQLENAEAKIKELKENQGASRKALLEEKEEIVKEFGKEADPVLNEAAQPVLKQARSLPSAVRDKAVQEIMVQKKKIKAQLQKSLDQELTKVINSAEKEYEKQIQNLKQAARGQIDKALSAAIKKAAEKLKEYAQDLEKSGLGLGFLKGKISFKEGTMNLEVKNWILNLNRIDLTGEKVGMQGKAQYGIFSQAGTLDLLLFLPESINQLGLLDPFKKDNRIEFPLDLTFNNQTGEYKLNKSPLSADQAKTFAVGYGVGYAERLIGVSDEGSMTTANLDKYKQAMKDIKQGKLSSAAKMAGNLSPTVEKYRKIYENANKAKDAAKKAKKAIKKLKKPW
jgi:hypothetical protein